MVMIGDEMQTRIRLDNVFVNENQPWLYLLLSASAFPDRK